MAIINVKGTHDIIGEEASLYSAVESYMRTVALQYAFLEVRPPVLEHSELFIRGVGESSDIVRKEMYTFLDKGDRSAQELHEEAKKLIMRANQDPKLTNVFTQYNSQTPQLMVNIDYAKILSEGIDINDVYTALSPLPQTYRN